MHCNSWPSWPMLGIESHSRDLGMNSLSFLLLIKTDFSFALLLATFEPLEMYQSYIPFWKAQECGNNA